MISYFFVWHYRWQTALYANLLHIMIVFNVFGLEYLFGFFSFPNECVHSFITSIHSCMLLYGSPLTNVVCRHQTNTLSMPLNHRRADELHGAVNKPLTNASEPITLHNNARPAEYDCQHANEKRWKDERLTLCQTLTMVCEIFSTMPNAPGLMWRTRRAYWQWAKKGKHWRDSARSRYRSTLGFSRRH
jgi:hypothetical protein